MKAKKFNHLKIEQCKISKESINTELDDYSIILDCRGEGIVSGGFYKTKQLLDLINGRNKEIVNSMMKKQTVLAQNLFNNILGRKEEVISID